MDYRTITELEGLHIMSEGEQYCFADCLARSFENYPLFEYFSGGRYNEEKMRTFWDVSISTGQGNILCIGNKPRPEAVILFTPPGYKDAGLFTYLKNGGFRIISAMGIPATARMLSFKSFAGKIKKKYAGERCWYIHSFAALPESRGKGYGSKLLRPMLAYFDRTAQDCYLETLAEENVAKYEHYGFTLMESTPVPKTDMTLYAMLRIPV